MNENITIHIALEQPLKKVLLVGMMA